MDDFHRDLPKAELHLHLEGSIEPATLLELEPAISTAEIEEHYRHGGFSGFLKNYVWVIRHLRTPADYALITHRLLQRLHTENVTYAEINLSAGVVVWKGLDLNEIYSAVTLAARESPVDVRWIFDAVRQWGPEKARYVAEVAVERAADGVVGFGFGGDEARGPAEWFAEVCAFARNKGLHLVPHAGETEGPKSVWAALQLGAERIGHGIRSVDDPALLRHLRDNDIPLEICISSNVATGAVAKLEEHPVRRIYEAGVPVILNTDDPAMFHTTLPREYEIAEQTFGFSRTELFGLAQNSFRYAFREVQ
jgi:adenosine deaminase/aminodeoxyfutalosine deaminase